MASALQNRYRLELGKGNVDFSTDTFYCMLVTTSHTPDPDTIAFRSDITGEASGTGYTAGGIAVSNLTITQDNTNNYAVVDFDPVVFSTVTLSNVDGAYVYKSTGAAATDLVVCYLDFAEGAQQVTANDFTVTPPAEGVLTV